MRNTLPTWFRYVLIALLALVMLIPVGAFLLVFILLSVIFVAVTSLPAWLGALLPMDEWLHTGIDRYLDINRMQLFRDDMLQIYGRHADIEDGLDRWWMLREMDAATERIDKKLRNGEFAVAVIAGVTSILFAIVAPLAYAGIVLTVFTISISIAALVRIVIIEILAYDSNLYQEAAYEDVAVRMGWNRGPINGRGAVLTALGTLVVGVDDRAYRLGKSALDVVVSGQYRDDKDERWVDTE